MSSEIQPAGASTPFDSIRHVDEQGREYWSARELQPLLDYTKWSNFERPLNEAIAICQREGDESVRQNFTAIGKVSGSRGPQSSDYHLTRHACYLIAQSCDGRKKAVAQAKTYFAIKTRQREEDEQDIIVDDAAEIEQWKVRAIRALMSHGFSYAYAKNRVTGILVRKDIEKRWVQEDHCLNCEVMFARLKRMGYEGGISIVKDFVHPLRPVSGHVPVQRYETSPGQQMQFDWGEFVYEQDGEQRRVYGLVAILGYSRMRFVCFTKRCDTTTLIRCLLQAFEYFGGLPQVMLTDRMKSVLLEMVDGAPHWNPQFADFAVALGVTARVCKAYTPQTKGKVERTVNYVKQQFWPGVTFTDLADLNRQALSWCGEANGRIHRTTHVRPVDRQEEEGVRPLPEGFMGERFATEERKVSWDGYISFDGVLYGLPAQAHLTGQRVQVREQHGTLRIWSGGQLVCQYPVQVTSACPVSHPEQWTTVPSAAAARRQPVPLGHQVAAPVIVQRSVQEYDQYLEVRHEQCV